MENIRIVLRRNHVQRDWSVEIDGTQHNHISSTTLDDLIEYALVSAEQSLIEPEADTKKDDSTSMSKPVQVPS
jgi:hypothetical protein